MKPEQEILIAKAKQTLDVATMKSEQTIFIVDVFEIFSLTFLCRDHLSQKAQLLL